MSDRAVRVVAMVVLAAALALSAADVSARQADAVNAAPGTPGSRDISRDILAARIDSLMVEIARRHVAVSRNATDMDTAYIAIAAVDTIVVGPFLVMDYDTVNMSLTANALATEWRDYALLFGDAERHTRRMIVTRTLPSSHPLLHDAYAYRLDPLVTGRTNYPRAARRVVQGALTDALPAAVRNWLGGAPVSIHHRFDELYRELALSRTGSVHACFNGDARECIVAFGLAGTTDTLSSIARSSLLAHALEIGGAGSYSRLSVDSTDVMTSLTDAAGIPIERLLASWRDTVHDGRPDIRAAVLRSGVWTLVWLSVLAALAMRSTRWRLE